MEFLIIGAIVIGVGIYLYFKYSKKSVPEVIASVEAVKVEEAAAPVAEEVLDVVEAAIKKPRASRKPKLNVAK